MIQYDAMAIRFDSVAEKFDNPIALIVSGEWMTVVLTKWIRHGSTFYSDNRQCHWRWYWRNPPACHRSDPPENRYPGHPGGCGIDDVRWFQKTTRIVHTKARIDQRTVRIDQKTMRKAQRTLHNVQHSVRNIRKALQKAKTAVHHVKTSARIDQVVVQKTQTAARIDHRKEPGESGAGWGHWSFIGHSIVIK